MVGSHNVSPNTPIQVMKDAGQVKQGVKSGPVYIVLQLVPHRWWLQLACPYLWLPQGPQHHNPFTVLHTYCPGCRKQTKASMGMLTLVSPKLHQGATWSGRQRSSPWLLSVENFRPTSAFFILSSNLKEDPNTGSLGSQGLWNCL